MTVGQRHRRHYKSGGCLEDTPLPARVRYVRTPRDGYTHTPRDETRVNPATLGSAILTRPEYFERMAIERATRKSMLRRAAERISRFFRRRP